MGAGANTRRKIFGGMFRNAREEGKRKRERLHALNVIALDGAVSVWDSFGKIVNEGNLFAPK